MLSSSPRWNIPDTPNYSDQELDWTPNRRTRTTSGSFSAYRRPHERRARRIATTGELDKKGRPLPSDPSKPNTLLTLEEIYAIAQQGDRSVMRDYTELFITTGINSYETKAEYAWIYLRPNDLGQLPLTEERMKVFFPEWEMVLKRSQPGAVRSSSSHTRINIPNPFKNEQPEPLDTESYYRSVEPGDPSDVPNDTDLRKEVRELRSENWHLRREVCLMREKSRISSLELHQAQSRILVYQSSALADEKRTFDTAFGQTGSYGTGPVRMTMPHLSQEVGNLMLTSYPKAMNDQCKRDLHFNPDLQQQQTDRGIFDQQNAKEGNPVKEPSGCIDREVRARILNSLTSADDLAKLTLHGNGQFTPHHAADVSPFVIPELNHPLDTADPFRSTPVYGLSHSEGASLSAQLPEYPPLDDQPRIDSQLFRELRSAQEKCTPVQDPAPPAQYDPMSINSLIDPSLSFSSLFGPSQELSTPVATHLSTPLSQKSLPLAAENSPPSNVSQGTTPTHSLRWNEKWMAALNDPRLANDPIRKFYEELDSHPPNISKKFGGYRPQSELPAHLQHLNPANPFAPHAKVLSEDDIRVLFDFGPSVRGRFERYFKRRDGYVKPDYRYLLYDVDAETGRFRLPALQLYSLDPQTLPHYINSRYADYRLPTTFRDRDQNRNKRVKTEGGGEEDQ